MRVTYTISFDDFLSLQRPFTLRPGRNAGFVAALVICGLVASLGLAIQGLAGAIFAGVGLLAALPLWLFEKSGVERKRKTHENHLAAAYSAIHCRDHRVLEADENGFTTSCGCGVLTRPWSELVQVSDVGKFLLLGTKKGAEPIPKSAFASEGDLTEFRTFLLGKLNQGTTPLAKNFAIAYSRSDFRSARWLHIWSGGGRRALFYQAVKVWGVAVIIYFVLIAMKYSTLDEGEARLIAIGGGLFVLLAPFLRRRRWPAALPARIFYDSHGLLVQDSVSRVRFSWEQFIGYLENRDVLLLYTNPRQYKIIPKRAFVDQGNSFPEILRSKVRPYEYKNPVPGTGVSALNAMK